MKWENILKQDNLEVVITELNQLLEGMKKDKQQNELLLQNNPHMAPRINQMIAIAEARINMMTTNIERLTKIKITSQDF